MTTRYAQQQLVRQLQALYDSREAANIADWVMEHITGKKKIDRLLEKDNDIPGTQQKELERITTGLLQHRPVQYVLEQAWFAGMPFFVNEQVLIPRPETEELVEWVATESRQATTSPQHLLDIGTGSGCIPIALKKLLPGTRIMSIDKSPGALAVAARNAECLNASIELQQMDFLEEANWQKLPVFDIIISNPPYIKQSEAGNMARHVTDHEPAMALFVPDEDALLFYRKIAVFAKTHLSGHGMLFLEVNEMLGEATTGLLAQYGYHAILKKDLQGKDRMIRASL